MRVQGRVHVDGIIEGKFDSNDDLSIGRHGRINGHVKARQVHVSGCLEGEVICDALYVEAGGQVRARVLSGEMSVDPRGSFQGEQCVNPPSVSVLSRRPSPEVALGFGIDAIAGLPDNLVLRAGSDGAHGKS